MTKYGIVTADSQSDFDQTKKAAYIDEDGFGVADEANKHKLKTPVKIADVTKNDSKQQ